MLTVEDRLDLTDLVHRYAALVDGRDFAGASGLFATDAVLVLPEPPARLSPVLEHRGRDAVRDALSVLRDVPRTFHAVVGTVIDADGEDATGRVACVAHHVTRRGEAHTDLVWHLHYADRYRRTTAGWRIARRELQIDLIEVRPVSRA